MAMALSLMSSVKVSAPCCSADVQVWAQTVGYHLILKDDGAACASVDRAVAEHPSSAVLWRLKVRSYARAERSRVALAAWRTLAELEGGGDEALLEEVAWAVLAEGIGSAAPQSRLAALVAAVMAGGGKTPAILSERMGDGCAAVRAVACRLAGATKAGSLVPALMRIVDGDRAWQVRCAAIEALGALEARGARAALVKAAFRPSATAEEREAAACALVLIEGEPSAAAVDTLAGRPELFCRLLACEVAANVYGEVPALSRLLSDTSPQVAAAALQALGLSHPTHRLDAMTTEQVVACTGHRDGDVAASAGWLLTLAGESTGPATLRRLLGHPRAAVRLTAAAAIVSAAAAAGGSALHLLEEALAATADSDTAVAATLAIGVIGNRTALPQALPGAVASLQRALADSGVRWQWQQRGIFRALAPAKGGGGEFALTEAADAATRLELIDILAVAQPSAAIPSLTLFLQERMWGVSAAAASLLLKEGGDDALALVQRFVEEAPMPKHRLQAALILALWGRDAAAVAPLHAAYPTASRDAREHILTALGRVGSPSSLPLFLQALDDPSPSLRIHAAASLLQALSH